MCRVCQNDDDNRRKEKSIAAVIFQQRKGMLRLGLAGAARAFAKIGYLSFQFCRTSIYQFCRFEEKKNRAMKIGEFVCGGE